MPGQRRWTDDRNGAREHREVDAARNPDAGGCFKPYLVRSSAPVRTGQAYHLRAGGRRPYDLPRRDYGEAVGVGMSRRQIAQRYRTEMVFASLSVAAAWVGGFIVLVEMVLH
jgi:hypothetical protein